MTASNSKAEFSGLTNRNFSICHNKKSRVRNLQSGLMQHLDDLKTSSELSALPVALPVQLWMLVLTSSIMSPCVNVQKQESMGLVPILKKKLNGNTFSLDHSLDSLFNLTGDK